MMSDVVIPIVILTLGFMGFLFTADFLDRD